MEPELSENTKKEINEYFQKSLKYGQHLYSEANSTLEMMLRVCDFVYITDGGSVIYAQKYCKLYSSMVPIDLAIKYGYTKPCKACAKGTYVEKLLSDRI